MTSPLPAFASRHPGLAFLARFALFFGLFELATLWSDPAGPNFVRLELTARPVAWIINTLTPGLAVGREGLTLVTGRSQDLLVGQGCEALPALLLFASAMAALPRPWRARLTGILMGGLGILLFNLARITGLYYVLVFAPGLFDLVHGYLGQMLTVAVAAGLFLILSREDGPRGPRPPDPGQAPGRDGVRKEGSGRPLAPGGTRRFAPRALAWLAWTALCLFLFTTWGSLPMRAVALVPEALVQAVANGQARAVERSLAALEPGFRDFHFPPEQIRVRGRSGPDGYDLSFGLARLVSDAPTPFEVRRRAEVEQRATRFNAYPFQLLVCATLPLLLVLPGLSPLARLGAAGLHLALLGLAYGLELFAAFLAEYAVLLTPLLEGRSWAGPLARRATLILQNGGEWFYAALILALCWRLFARRGGKAE